MKKTLILFLFTILMFISNNCNDKTVDPKPNDSDTLPQEDIKWASLANSAWPMNHGNPQSNGRSSYSGPIKGEVSFKIQYYGIESSLVLGKNNELFVTSNYYPHRISAMKITGDTIWESLAGGNIATTPILTDSIVYWADASGLNSYTLEGKKKWKYDNNCSIWNIGINIGQDGIIYCITEQNVLKAISPEGILLWELKDERFRADEHGAPTFSPDGTTLYVQGNNVSILAVDIQKRLVKWVFGDYELWSSPVIDSYGSIYFIPGEYKNPDTKTLYALDAMGVLIWQYDFEDDYILDNTEPTIDYDGNIFFGGSIIYSVNYKGKLRWQYNLNNLNIVSPLVNDVNGNLYIGAADLGNTSILSILSLDNNGNLNWKTNVEGENFLGASPAISNDGQLLFPSFRSSNIIIIK